MHQQWLIKGTSDKKKEEAKNKQENRHNHYHIPAMERTIKNKTKTEQKKYDTHPLSPHPTLT